MKNLKYNYVYKITNKINGHFYYGVHRTNNLNDKYMGSGTRLYLAYQKYGKENFTKEIIEFFDTYQEALNLEEKLVTEKEINDPNCYNIVLGGGKGTAGTVVVKDKNGNTLIVPTNDPRYLSGEFKSANKGYIPVIDKDGNYLCVKKDDPRYLTGELVYMFSGKITVKDKDGNNLSVDIDDPRYLSGELKPISYKRVTVKDKNGNTLQVSIDDPRYLSGELKHIHDGQTIVKDKDGNLEWVDLTDPRYLSGELVPMWKGKKHSDRCKQKISETLRKNASNKGPKNGMFGKIYIHRNNERKIINKEELNKYLSEGWISNKYSSINGKIKRYNTDIRKTLNKNDFSTIRNKIINIIQSVNIDFSKNGWQTKLVNNELWKDLPKSNIKRLIKFYCPEYLTKFKFR